MTENERHAEGRTLCRILKKHLHSPISICAYFPLKSEVDIRMLLKKLIERGDKVFLPRFEDGMMVFRQALDLQNLSPGEFTIPEPPKNAPLLKPEEVDIILVPGRAFDRRGNRLGRGSGGYDQWLKKHRKENPHSKLWGTCLECQLVNEVPVEEHDVRMDAVVTARGLVEIDNG